MMLTPSSSTPLFEQVMNHLRTQIESGQAKEGTRLPSEAELCEQFEVSRITIRRALKELEEEGLLERRQGKGTFFSHQKFDIHAMAIDGFQGMNKKHQLIDSRISILRKDSRSASTKEARLLGIQPRDLVYELTRRLDIKNVPIMIDRSVYDAKRFPGILDLAHENISTYDVMANVYHIENYKVDKEITITTARANEAQTLNCFPGETMFYIVKSVYDKVGTVNHCSFELIIANRIKMTLSYSR